MAIRERFLAGVASQLGRPSGLRGRLVGRLLNRGNRRTISEAVEALALQPGETAADLGFGGGLGLALLLGRVGPGGQVHGVELSSAMLAGAARRFRQQVAGGRLHLHAASVNQLPLAGGSIDGAITINTVYFIAELDQAFSELARVLSPSGRLVVGLGDPEAMARLPFTSYGFRIRPVPELIGALTAAGLALREHRRVGEAEHASHLLVLTPARAAT